MSHLFELSLNVKQIYLTYRWDPIRCYHSEPEWTWEQWQLRGTQHYWSLTIWLFSVISRTLIGWGLTALLQRCFSRLNSFTFGLIPLEKLWTPLSTPTSHGLNKITAVLSQRFFCHSTKPHPCTNPRSLNWIQIGKNKLNIFLHDWHELGIHFYSSQNAISNNNIV